MEAYIYKAALLCGDCGAAKRAQLEREAISRKLAADAGVPVESAIVIDVGGYSRETINEALGFDPEGDFDSDDYPAGPYGHGGGEADSPNHCDKCGLFLENDLTSDGVAYVIGEWLDFLEGQGDAAVLRAWFWRYLYILETEEELITATVKDRLEAALEKATVGLNHG